MEVKELEQIDFNKVHIQDLFRMVMSYFAYVRVLESEFCDIKTTHLKDFAYSVSSCALKDFGIDGENKDPKQFFDNWVNQFSQSLKHRCEEYKHPHCEEVY